MHVSGSNSVSEAGGVMEEGEGGWVSKRAMELAAMPCSVAYIASLCDWVEACVERGRRIWKGRAATVWLHGPLLALRYALGGV